MLKGSWHYSIEHSQICQVIEIQTLWGEITCRALLSGCPQVRDYRLNLLQQEERAWKEEIERKTLVYPEMIPLIIVRVEGAIHD
jgi:hypothetical protein